MKTQFTPGPWETSRDAVPPGHVQITVYAESTGERVATAFEREANAQLIAAAPDLLNALGLAVATLERVKPAHTHGPFNTLQGTLDVARAAIQKAQVSQ